MDEKYKNIINEINKSGFPNELRVVEILRRNNYLTFPNLTFLDELRELHEIDAISMLVSGIKNWKYGMAGISLIIECKKSKEKPWIFFEEVHDPLTSFGLVPKLSYISDIKINGDFDSLIVGSANSALHKHHYENNIPIARTYFEAFKNQENKSDIYKAVTSVWFAHTYFKEWFVSGNNANKEDKKKRSLLTHPVIILDGELIVARKTKNSFSIEPVNHLFLRTIDNMTTKNSLFFPTKNEIIIDVIKSSYLSNYLRLCKMDLTAFRKHLLYLSKSKLIE
jgi:hypothetical protein